ncbi:Zn-dependent M28 family amino/carboxypeptidase [Novosphingobium fluoreni]|uniref:Zn-dependent M28 family amino/carboxypeptidase n=1 Tax=Novosphingobium fluoreni TaxID=1391222 RepID=A0A7W6BZD4_9SPHN|nr:Zn-dependent M28 family amino/carboxypeptidase [Novosphingobium fluoreni]
MSKIAGMTKSHLLATLSAAFTLAVCAPALAEIKVDPASITRDVKTLASDAFEGRAPGTTGETRTIEYLIERLRQSGLEPGGPAGQWVQAVPLLHTTLGQGPVSLGSTPVSQGREIYLSTLRPDDTARVEKAPMVFVGYGVNAPERQWDDFKGVDLTGKVAVFLINDPDFSAAPDEAVSGNFGGRKMTYYGRWTYKFEEAARRGAIGALIVHDTPGAGYGWNVVTSPRGENYDILRKPENLISLRVQGWIEGTAATDMFQQAGLDLGQLRIAARKADFRPVPLSGLTFSAALPVTHEDVISHNVLGRIPGARHPEEVVFLGAHWDAYGKGEPDAKGRVFRAGANDDALGVAGLLEIARAMKTGPVPDRSVMFAFWTAEERGLLGSEFYAATPVYPIEKTVANLTLDILQTAGAAKDVVLVGQGQNTLENDMARIAKDQGRTVTPESLPERGLFYRADHFSFAKRGVPVLLQMGIAGASDLKQGGRTAGQAWIDNYTGNCYHQACDAWEPAWDITGAVQDIELVGTLAQDLATSSKWPEWKPGSEFKAIRDKTSSARRQLAEKRQ